MSRLPWAVWLILAMVGCSGGSETPSSPSEVPGLSSALALTRGSWDTISDPAAFPLRNDAGSHLVFDFPATGSINYLYNSQPPRVIGGALSISLQVSASDSAIFNFMTEPFNTCPTPASVRPLIWTNRNGFGDFDRWWANQTAYVLAPGATTMTVALTPDQWSNVNGTLGSAGAAAQAGFAAALRNVSSLGLTFGGGCFFGHGVNVPRGTATFTLLRYGVQNAP